MIIKGKDFVSEIDKKLNKNFEEEQKIAANKLNISNMIIENNKNTEEKDENEPITIEELNNLIEEFNNSTGTFLITDNENFQTETAHIYDKNIDDDTKKKVSFPHENFSGHVELSYSTNIVINKGYEFLESFSQSESSSFESTVSIYKADGTLVVEVVADKNANRSVLKEDVFLAPGEYTLTINCRGKMGNTLSFTSKPLLQGRRARMKLPLFSEWGDNNENS